MADHDGQDPVTENPQAVIAELQKEMQIANLMLADLGAQLIGATVKQARANAVAKLSGKE